MFPSAQDHKGTFTTITKHDDRRLSAAVIGEGPGNVEPIGAFEVSQRKRILQIAVAVIYCLFAAGIVFGYAALKPVLIAEKVYREYCSPEEIEENVRVCYQQELRLNFMFTVAAVATNVCALLVGTILDQFGPRVAGIIGSWLLAAGLAGFGFSKSITFVDREYSIEVLKPWLTENSISHLLPPHGPRRPFHLHPVLPPRQRFSPSLRSHPLNAHWCLRCLLHHLPRLPRSLSTL